MNQKRMKIVIPARGMKLSKYPDGHIYQGHGENPDLYRNAINITGCGLTDCRMNGHNGIDIAMPEGTDILATAGKVVEVKDTPEGYGKHIRILTDFNEEGLALELTYGHLKDVNTALGMRVKDEQVIGSMGNTGFIISGSTPFWGNAPAGKGVHLHLTARIVTNKQNQWPIHYSTNDWVYCLNYNNGIFGSVDPVSMIQEWLDKRYKEIRSTLQKITEVINRILKGFMLK